MSLNVFDMHFQNSFSIENEWETSLKSQVSLISKERPTFELRSQSPYM